MEHIHLHNPFTRRGLTGGEHAPRSGRPGAFASTLNAQLTRGPDRVILKDWAGGIPEEMATLPQIRLGRRWYTFGEILGFLVVVGLALLGGGILIARYLRTLPDVQAFIAAHPGTRDFGPAVTSGFPFWLRYQHY